MNTFDIDNDEIIHHIYSILKGMNKRSQSEFIMNIINNLNVEIPQEELIDIIDQAASYAY